MQLLPTSTTIRTELNLSLSIVLTKEIIRETNLTVLAWPGAVLLLGIVALLLFRAPLSRFLDRAQKIGREGIQAAAPKQEIHIESKPSPADELFKTFDNALLVHREQLIRSELSNLAITDLVERERVLIRFLASLQIVRSFEYAYAWIWGSQLTALQSLNSVGMAGAPVEFLRPWYEQAAAQEAALYKNYSFEQWLGFLHSNSLVAVSDETVTITLEGREFLQYVIRQGYSLYKRG